MATRQYDVSEQDAAFQVAQSVGGAISEGVRLTIDLAVIGSKSAALLTLDNLKQHILENAWPPA